MNIFIILKILEYICRIGPIRRTVNGLLNYLINNIRKNEYLII